MIDNVISYTRRTPWARLTRHLATSASNTSAIIATQKAAPCRWSFSGWAFTSFMEDYVRIFLDIMRTDYGLRQVAVSDENGQQQQLMFDFSALDRLHEAEH